MREELAGRVDAEEGLRPGQVRDGELLRRLKSGFFHHRDWSGVSVPELCLMLDVYLMRCYNEGRPKERLGWMSPMQYCRSLGWSGYDELDT